MRIGKFTNLYRDVTKEGTRIPQEKYCLTGQFPIVDQGQRVIAGWWNDDDGIFKDVPAIIFGDHTRAIKYMEEPFFIGADGVKILRPTNAKDNPKYLYYALQAAKIPNLGYSRHFKVVKELEIRMYSRDEQDEIVHVLEKIDHLIEQRHAETTYLDQLVKSRFIELFGDLKSNPMEWPVVPFTEFAKIDGNMTMDYEKYADYPHIGIDSIEKGTGAIKGYRTVREDGVISGKYIFTSQHIIYSKIRPNLNKVALPDFEGVCSADAYPILPNHDNCNRVFLAIALRSEYFLEYILQFSSRTNLPKVNRKEIAGFRMPLPPLKLQEQFAAFVEQTDKSKLAVQKGLQELEILKKSLMQQYFG